MHTFPTLAKTQKVIDFIERKASSYWQTKEKERALSLFHKAAIGVPAYKDFLLRHKIDHEKILNWNDFHHVPSINKNNYLRAYPYEDLLWDGSIKNKSLVFTATSGSTGNPFYFPRDHEIEWQSSISHEIFLKHILNGSRKTTLVINSFGMGVWIGGMITYQAFRHVGDRGYPLTIICPGVSKEEIFATFKNVGHHFDQIILCGYPPFVKDILDEGGQHNIMWSKFNLKILMAAEGFSERFRDYIAKKGAIRNPILDISNIYGTADLGSMAHERPVSVIVKKIALKNKAVFRSLFGNITKIPTLAQYNPLFISFQEYNGSILCTSNNSLPLVRYEIGDQGGTISFETLKSKLAEQNIDIISALEQNSSLHTLSQIPFVFIYERNDLSTKLRGAIMYPEHIKEILMLRSFCRYLTGRFQMSTKHDAKQNQFLEIVVETKDRVQPAEFLLQSLTSRIVSNLKKKNAEFSYLFEKDAQAVTPVIKMESYGNSRYFSRFGKQRWVVKPEAGTITS